MRAVTSILIFSGLMVAGCGGGNSGSGTGTTPPPTAPTVMATTPASGATGVTVTSMVTATFSQAMNAATISSSTFTLATASGAVTGTVAYSSATNSATFTPSANLSYGTQYTATITTGATNSSGTALAANDGWSFTTVAAPTPAVTAVTPTSASTGVAITSVVTASFSEAMNASTISGSTFTLTPQGGAAVSANVTYSSNAEIATLAPLSPLAYNTQYTATLTTGVQSAQGAALAANYTWNFTTAAAPPPAPTVTSVTPASNATGAAVNTSISATFSEAMNSATMIPGNFTLTGPGGAVTGTVSYNSTTQTATFDPGVSLAYGTTYTATITTGAMSSGGAALAANDSWSFTTVYQPDVAATQPGSNAMGVSTSQALTATFSQPMNSATINASTFTLSVAGGAAVAGVVTYNTTTAVAAFTPNAALAGGTQYTATITTGATSAEGVALASNYLWNFTTAANPNQVTVNFGTTYQTIRGFGGSTAWLGALTTQQASELFNETNGLGLSILRVRIDPTGSATSIPAWVPTDGNWGQELANAQEALSANSNAIVFATPWTPPLSMKTSSASQPYWSGSPACGTGGSGSDYCGGYLNPTSYADYAGYLEDFVTYFANNGVDLYAISMQNEPDYADVDYESCYWTPQQMGAWIASLAASPFGATKLIMPESFDFSVAQAQTAMDDPTAEPLIGILAGHLYGVSPTSAYYNLAQPDGKDVWMTEHSLTPAGSNPAIGDALALAEEIHNSMTVGYYNAYVWWWIWDDPNDGINYGLINSNTTSPAPTYYGYAIGQFSKFIQPGYVRASATANPASGVYVSAYNNPGSGTYHYVIVAINSNTSTENLTFNLNSGTATSLTPYETTAAGGLTPQTAVSVTGGQFTYTLPAQSIVTFVQ
ncbi:MAG: Ig-like domain-containing protein [Terracidiphilus sp.]